MDYIVKAYKDWKLHSQFQEIVPDMDDEYIFNEKQSIRESARSLKKYGSTCCNHVRNNETLIRHDVEKTDTLQGIALKYGCTTEQIRRANRLFASDSLFLRQYLLVPVDKSSPYFPKVDENNVIQDLNTAKPTTNTPSTDSEDSSETVVNSNNNNHNNSTHNALSASTNGVRSFGTALPTRPYSIAGELLVQTGDEDAALSNHNSASGSNKQSKSLDSVVTMTPEEENRKCINDFLNKIDNTISESRKYVEKSKEMISSQSDNNLFITTEVVQRKRNNHINTSYRNNSHQNHMRQSSSGSTSDTAQLLNTTQTRRVQNSLKRLEKEQDEFFEL